MNEVVLECTIEELKAAFKHLHVALPKKKKLRGSIILEINFRPQEVEFSIVGAKYHFALESGAVAKVVMPYRFMEVILKEWKGPTFLAVFQEGLISFAGTTLESNLIKVVRSENGSAIANNTP